MHISVNDIRNPVPQFILLSTRMNPNEIWVLLVMLIPEAVIMTNISAFGALNLGVS